MKKIQKDLQSRSFKLYYHISKLIFAKTHPTANFDLYLNFGNADFGLHEVYHVTFVRAILLYRSDYFYMCIYFYISGF